MESRSLIKKINGDLVVERRREENRERDEREIDR